MVFTWEARWYGRERVVGMATIIVYRWNSNSEQAFVNALKRLGIGVVECNRQIKDYHADAVFAKELIDCIHAKKAAAVFSYDYFPIISSVCEVNQIPYISWIYDCPLHTLNSVTIRNQWNFIFCFDALYTQRLKERGALHCVAMPLGVDVQEFQTIIEGSSAEERQSYRCDISFVGNLYNDDRNRLRSMLLETTGDDDLTGYLEGIIAAQKKVYGDHFIEQMLTDRVVEQIAESCALTLGKMYEYTQRELAAEAVDMEITAREREEVLLVSGDVSQVALYTGSALSDRLKAHERIHNRGYADNHTQMPLIFRESKINLNVTSKSITSGIPLRVLDILACGGFCLTNYQPEVAQYFADGEELVMYTDMEDLRNKLSYYLAHDEERSRIARNGQRAVSERFALEDRIREMVRGVRKN